MTARTIPKFKAIPLDDYQNMAFSIPVHFVGLRYYTVQSFVEEAERMGVSRALPPNIVKRFDWGHRIFLAIHVKEESEDGKTVTPTAVVFGFFVIEWLNFKGTPRLHDAVAKDPRLQANYMPLPQPAVENRGCGEYMITGVTSVGDDVTLGLLVSVIQEHARRFGDKFKLMVGGRFYPLQPAKLHPVKFTQNVTWVGLDDEAADFIMGQVNSVEDKDPVVPPVFPKQLRRKHHIRHLKNYRLAKPAVRTPEERKNLLDFGILPKTKKGGWTE